MDPQSIVLRTPTRWPYRASMDIAPLDDLRVPTALALLAELGQPVVPLAERVGHALDLLRDPARTPSLAHAHAEAAAHHPGHDPALLEECRTLSLTLATTWRWGPGGHLPGRPSDRRGVAG